MVLFPKKAKTWPYAADSVGRPRGTIEIGGKIGSIPCYEAVGSAREVFPTLSKDIFGHLERNLTRLQEPDTFVGVSLFMIGRVARQTKPVVMIVSNDKALRKEAFRSVRDDSDIMKEYPGFDLGHISLKAEFDLKNLQALAEIFSITSQLPNDIEPTSEEESWRQQLTAHNVLRLEKHRKEPYPTVLVGKNGPSTCRRLVVRDSAGSTRTAVGGGLVSYQGRYMFHTVQHFLKAQDERAQTVRSVDLEETCSADDSGDCEMTGVGDFDDDYDEDFVEITSHGSVSPASETDESAGSETDENDTLLSSSLHQIDHALDLQARLQSLMPMPSPSTNTKDDMFLAGTVSMSSQVLDSSLIEVRPSEFETMGLSLDEVERMAIPLEDFANRVEMKPRDGAIRASTPDGGSIGGVCLGTPSYFCLPGSKTFVEVYLAKLNRPLVAGECGTWIRDAVSGKLFGHVVAGSPSTGLAMIVPAHHALSDALASLQDNILTWPSKYSSFYNHVSTSSVAYVLFTSGSTGTPKDPANDHISNARISKLRLTKEEVMILEAKFQKSHKPGSTAKKTLAESMGMEVSRINNWFQNRRAQEKSANRRRHEEEMQNAELEKSPPDPGLHDEAFLTLEKLYRQHLYPVLLWLESRYDRDLDEVNKPFQNNLDQNFTSSTEPPLPLNSRVLKLSRLYTRMSHIQRPEAFDAWLRLRSRMSTSPSKAELTSQKVDAPLLTHSGYERPMYPRVHCGRCNLNPAGFRGQHELQRHMDTRHKHDTVNDDVDRWEWPSDLQSRFAALWRTSRREEHWNEAYYNAAAYLRRTHFKLKGSHLQADVTKQPQIPPSIFHTESSDSYISLNAELPVLHRELCRRELQFITVSAAVGLGLFIQTGSPLFVAGPVGLCISFVFSSAITWALMVSLAEIISSYPIPWTLYHLSHKWVDGGLSFALAWGYFLSMTLVIPFGIVTANIANRFLTDKVPVETIIVYIMTLHGLISIVSVRYFRTLQSYIAVLKVLLMIGLMFFVSITTQGKGRAHCDNPSRVEVFNESEGTRKLSGVIYWVFLASFSIAGAERVVVTAGETKSTGKNSPIVRSVDRRNRVFFLGSCLLVAIVGGLSGLDLPDNLGVMDTGAASPYTIALERMSMSGLQFIAKALITTSMFNTGNSIMYTASRTLHAMSLEGRVPRLFSWSAWNGVSLQALLLSLSFFLLDFLKTGSSSAIVMTYLMDLVVYRQVINIAFIMLKYTHSCKQGIAEHLPMVGKRQVISRDRLLYKDRLQPYIAYLGLAATSFILSTGEHNSTLQEEWSLITFLGDCSMITLFALALLSDGVLLDVVDGEAMVLSIIPYSGYSRHKSGLPSHL